MTYRVEFSEDADDDLEDISDNRVRTTIIKRAYDLGEEPEKQGKPLTYDLKGLYSVRAVGQRYRIIYRIRVLELTPPGKEKTPPTIDRVVTIVVVGIRKEGSKQDAYEIARKRLGKK